MIYAASVVGCRWWMVSWQGWQTTRVLRRILAMRAAQAGWAGPGGPSWARLSLATVMGSGDDLVEPGGRWKSCVEQDSLA